MAYSGTVGQTVITVQQLIDHGARRCGKLAEELTVEQVQSAKESLFILLSNIANQGINYWAINKLVVGLKPDQYIYSLPVGTVDALNVLYSTMNSPNGSLHQHPQAERPTTPTTATSTTYCQQTSPNGNIAVVDGTNDPQYIGSMGFMPYIAGGGSGNMELHAAILHRRIHMEQPGHRHQRRRDGQPEGMDGHRPWPERPVLPHARQQRHNPGPARAVLWQQQHRDHDGPVEPRRLHQPAQQELHGQPALPVLV